MGIAARMEATLESWSTKWKDRLRGWMVSWVTRGIVDSLEDMLPEQRQAINSIADKLISNPDVPENVKEFLRRAQSKGNPLLIAAGVVFGLLMVVPMVFAVAEPLANLLKYKEERLLHSFRLDPSMVTTAWRRAPDQYAALFDDLRDLGWTEKRLEALKLITEIIPGVPDLIRMSVREAFTPEIAEKFGQYQDPPILVYPWAEKLGLSKDWVDRYWAAHWELPSTSLGYEMLHRGIITEDELKLLLRALDIMPFWRDRVIKASWNVPTRVDVRRFWDMRTIDEARLREVYTSLGYHGKDLDDYVLWTKIYTDFPDLLARYKNGWITLEQVKSELIAIGMKPERADTMIEEKVKKAAPERVAKERDLTAAEIIKGIKKAIITDVEGAELLQDMGYDAEEAWFKIAIDVTAGAGSPDTFAEFKDLTQKWRLAVGLKATPVIEEIKKLGAEKVRLSAEVDTLTRSIKEEQGKLLGTEALPTEATARLKELQATLYKAQAELARVKTDYNAKIVEWKHKVG